MTASPSIQNVGACLFFEGRCEAALEIYRGTLGAEVITLMRIKARSKE